MSTVKIKDKEFAISIPEERILAEVDRLAKQISQDFEGKNPLFLGVLNGSFMFAADLFRRITIPAEISFVKLVKKCTKLNKNYELPRIKLHLIAG